MAINATTANVRGRNVEPRSSILDMQTLDVDASGLTVAPQDGEFVVFNGALQAATNPSADTVTAKAQQLRMVWSEAGRSDLQATGRARVPVIFRHSFHCELALYNYDTAETILPGYVLVVRAAAVAVEGDTGLTRLVAQPMLGTSAAFPGLAAAGSYWIVGTVLKAPSTVGGPIEVMIFDTPQQITVA